MILEVKFKGKLQTEAVSFVLLKQISTITDSQRAGINCIIYTANAPDLMFIFS